MSATQGSSDQRAAAPSSEAGARQAAFVTTHWSVVLTASRSDTTRAQAALARLCQAYWYPLYAYVRRRGYAAHDAQDFHLTGAGQIMGTPNYMAPEQVEHPQAVDHRADIYSLGVVFYEMLTGELPLGKFAPPSSRTHGTQIDVRLDEVVLRALEKEPGRRYQHASEVKTDVESITTGSAEQPSTPSN